MCHRKPKATSSNRIIEFEKVKNDKERKNTREIKERLAKSIYSYRNI